MAKRPAGANPSAFSRIREDLAATRETNEEGEGRIGEGTRVMQGLKLRLDWNAGDELSSNPKEWRESPQSTRVVRYRWDPGNGQIHVVFQRTGARYVYRDVPVTAYYNMNRARSKGRFINRVLNKYDYGRADSADW